MASAGAGAPAVAGTSRGWRDSWTARAVLRTRGWTRAGDLRVAFVLAAVALVIRVIWVLAVTRRAVAFNDSLFYDLVGRSLASGHGFSLTGTVPTAGWPPLYPFLLSLAFRLFGDTERVGYLLNAFIGAASVPLLYLVARRAFGRREAVFAAAVLALFPTQVFLSDVLISETLDVFMLLALFALLTVLPPTRAAAALIGVFIGLCALTRNEDALLIVVPMVAWWRVLTPRRRLVRVAILAVSVAVVVTPWIARNSERVHVVALSTNGGQTLYSAHNPHATGAQVYAPASLIAADQRRPQPQREVYTNRTLTRYAEHWALRHPLQEILLIPKRFISLVGDDGDLFPLWVLPDGTRNPTIARAGAHRLTLLTTIAWSGLFLAFMVVLVLGGRALWSGGAGEPSIGIVRGALSWIAVTTLLYCVVFYGQWRYHVALEPLMILVVSPAACAAWSARRDLAACLSRR